MSGNGKGTAAQRVRLWTRDLFEEILPVQTEPGVPVLLACDDETIRVVAERLGFDFPNPSTQFASDVRVFFDIGNISGFSRLTVG